jgi:hypothetical protein
LDLLVLRWLLILPVLEEWEALVVVLEEWAEAALEPLLQLEVMRVVSVHLVEWAAAWVVEWAVAWVALAVEE